MVTSAMSPILTVNNLTKRFGDFTAVDNLSFVVKEGDVFGFLGQNGAGKSTTIRMLTTLISPTSGSIEMMGKSLNSHRDYILARTGAMIERPDFYKYLSAEDNLALCSRLSGIQPTREFLFSNLEMVGLKGREKDKVKTYSQGMKQRLGIAAALIHDPQIVILDEPVNGLDPQGIIDIRNLILALNRERGKTVIVSSHLLSEIEQIATRVLIIDKGKKLVEGTADELFDPAKTVVEIETPDREKTIQHLSATQWGRYLELRGGNYVYLTMNKQLIPQLNREIVQAGIDVVSIKARLSLEDYFLQVTGGKQHVEPFKH